MESNLLELSILLRESLVEDNRKRAAAEEQLGAKEEQPGFFSTLLSIVSKKEEMSVQVRWLAVVVTKNSLDRCWRKTTQQVISLEEKQWFRERLLSLLLEEEQLVATQLYLLLGRVVRLDYPKDWPTVFEEVLKMVHSCSNSGQLLKLLKALYEMVKSVASIRMQQSKVLFHEASTRIVEWIFRLMQQCLHFLPNISAVLYIEQLPSVDFCVLEHCLKILRKTITVDQFIMNLQVSFDEFIQWILHNHSIFFYNGTESERTRRLSYLFSKLVLESQKMHPLLFSRVLSYILYEYVQQWKHCSDMDWTIRPFLQWSHDGKALDICYHIIECKTIYSDEVFDDATSDLRIHCDLHGMHQISTDWSKEELESAQRQIWQSFSPPFVATLLEIAICHFLPLSREQQVKLIEDPCEFAMEEEAAEFDLDNIQTIAKALCQSMLTHFFDSCLETLRQLLKNVNDRQGLSYDVIYRILGAAMLDIFDRIEYDEWMSILSGLFSEPLLHNPLLRRRACIFGGEIGPFLSWEQRISLFKMILHIFLEETNVAIGWSALQALESILASRNQTSDYQEESLSLFADDKMLSVFLQHSFQMLQHVCSLSMKCDILDLITRMVEILSSVGLEHVYQDIASGIINLWNETSHSVAQDEARMLQSRIVDMIQNFLSMLQSSKTPLMSIPQWETFVQQLIAWHIRKDWLREEYEEMIEQGLALWIAFLQCHQCYSPLVHDLFPRLMDLAQQTVEFLGQYMMLFKNYLLLGKEEFLASYGTWLCHYLYSILQDVRDRIEVQIAEILHYIIIYYDKNWSPWIPIMKTMVFAIFRHDKSRTVEASYAVAIAQALWMDIENFEKIVLDNHEEVMAQVINFLVDRMECVVSWSGKKQVALALCQLAIKRKIFHYVCVELVADVWLQCLSEVPLDSLSKDSSEVQLSVTQSQYPESSERKDPIEQEDIRIIIRRTIEHLQSSFPVDYHSSFWETMDVDVASSLKQLIEE
eukprot:jgi/Galph1/5545/GphlegSOOS_G4141.1